MNWLKKVGLALAKGAEVVGELAGYGPIIHAVVGFLPKGVQPLVQGGISDITLMAKEIITAEKVLAATTDPALKTGSQKLTAATPGIALIMNQWATSGVMGSAKLLDKAKADAAVKGMASNLADYLSAFGD